jgi:hypothetical protein
MPKGYVRRVPAPPPPVAPPVEGPVDIVDQREARPWFLRLPPAAQEEYRARWKAGDERGVRREKLVKDTLRRSVAQGAGTFVFTETCCAVPSWGHSAAALLVGAALGVLWHRIGAGRFRCMTTSVLPYAALRVAFVSDSFLTTAVFGMLGLLMLLSVTGLVGFVRERRRADDQDY